MFHVPEKFRIVANSPLASTSELGNNGAFVIESPIPNRTLWIIASDATVMDVGWEHVSAHVTRGKDTGRNSWATPTWEEMCFLKDLFWDEEDVVMQLHPRKSEYVNTHPHTLHLWRPTTQEIPTPPKILVG